MERPETYRRGTTGTDFAVIHTEGSEVCSSSQEVRFAGGYSFYNLNYKKAATKEEQQKENQNTEKAKFIGMPYYHDYKKCLEERVKYLTENEVRDLFDEIGTILTCYKNDDSRTERLAKLGLVPIEMEGLLAYTPTKFQQSFDESDAEYSFPFWKKA